MNTLTPVPIPSRILIAEDEAEIRDYLQIALRRPNFIIDFAEDGEEVLTAFAEGGLPSLLIMDIMMPRKDGIATLKDIRRTHPDLPIIMLSGLSASAHIVEAMKSGASDYLTKPVSHEALRRAVDLHLAAIPAAAAKALPHPEPGPKSVSAGNWTRGLEPLLERIAGSDVPVLLEGETGSGKEVLARRLHTESLRSGQVFLKLNCAALPSELVESELFGYERGSFTGAFKSNPGKFELANGGTIFLDEIGDMDLKLQAKLLQVLQDQEFLRIGAREPTRVNVRVIAATHRDLQARIADGEFREDLYYRLNIVRIVIPPLRDRRDEIMPLASLFLRKHHAGKLALPAVTPDLRAAILAHSWPGNIRELENLMRQYLIVGDPAVIIAELQRRIERERAFSGISASHPASASPDPCEIPAVGPPRSARALPPNLAKVDLARKTAETEVIIEALNASLWNRKRAAAQLGIDYKALLYKMKKLSIG